MKYKKKKEPKKQPPITIIGDCVTREIIKLDKKLPKKETVAKF